MPPLTHHPTTQVPFKTVLLCALRLRWSVAGRLSILSYLVPRPATPYVWRVIAYTQCEICESLGDLYMTEIGQKMTREAQVMAAAAAAAAAAVVVVVVVAAGGRRGLLIPTGS